MHWTTDVKFPCDVSGLENISARFSVVLSMTCYVTDNLPIILPGCSSSLVYCIVATESV